MKKVRYAFTAFTALLAACAAHSPMIVHSTVDTTAPAVANLSPHHERVFVTQDSLPSSTYDFVSLIDVGKVWYGGSNSVLVSMADRARELGADAVIDVKTWHQPSGFSWAAPHGSGKAIKFKNKSEIDFSKLHGDWM
jgi:hypothetical protein